MIFLDGYKLNTYLAKKSTNIPKVLFRETNDVMKLGIVKPIFDALSTMIIYFASPSSKLFFFSSVMFTLGNKGEFELRLTFILRGCYLKPSFLFADLWNS